MQVSITGKTYKYVITSTLKLVYNPHSTIGIDIYLLIKKKKRLQTHSVPDGEKSPCHDVNYGVKSFATATVERMILSIKHPV